MVNREAGLYLILYKHFKALPRIGICSLGLPLDLIEIKEYKLTVTSRFVSFFSISNITTLELRDTKQCCGL